MDFAEYQQQCKLTDQRSSEDPEGLVVHLLGLAGEAGSVAAEYKKRLRDGESHAFWKFRIREELGDTLWYLSTLATHFGLDLDEIAQANLTKTQGRWTTSAADALDTAYPPSERLPRSGMYEFVPGTSAAGRPAMTVHFEGHQVGDQITDASQVEDGYRFHDAFHLSYAALLGWSPVTRALLGRKRRSNPGVDENEDGGRAVVIEEGIAALVFGYASQHRMLEGVKRVDQRLLDTIEMVVSTTEVGVRSQSDWERAILAGFEMFRQLDAHGGGTITFDADAATLTYTKPDKA